MWLGRMTPVLPSTPRNLPPKYFLDIFKIICIIFVNLVGMGAGVHTMVHV